MSKRLIKLVIYSPILIVKCRSLMMITKRIHFNGSWLCPDGHKLQLWVKGQSTGLMREPMFHSLWEKHRQSQTVGKTNRSTISRWHKKDDNKKRSNLFLFSLNALLCLSMSVCIFSEASIREDSLYKLRGKFLKSTDGSSTALLKRSADFV